MEEDCSEVLTCQPHKVPQGFTWPAGGIAEPAWLPPLLPLSCPAYVRLAAVSAGHEFPQKLPLQHFSSIMEDGSAKPE